MNRRLFYSAILAAFGALPGFCQDAPPKTEPVPLYRVTVVERNVDAVNYQYHSAEPSRIDFRGTVLLPAAKGGAMVDSRRGRTQIDAKFDNLEPPSKFGPAYLSYVLWAISPEGAPHNVGEIIPDSGNHGRLVVTTELQAFGMVVTAEPYSSVRQPSDVVVMENRVRLDTIGSVKPIQAKYELMPRGHYVYEVPQAPKNVGTSEAKVSMREYEALLELYEAQNAVGFARAAEAERYASDTLAKAERELKEAQRLQSAKGDTSQIVQHAREAAQTAEDARVIARRRAEADRLAAAQSEILQARQAMAQAEAAAQQARAEIEAARAQAEAEHAAQAGAEAAARAARQQADRLQTPPPPPPALPAPASREGQMEVRSQLMRSLNEALPTRDTPRGLVVTVKDVDFNDLILRQPVVARLARVAKVVASQPGLRVAVEGHTDTPGTERSEERAAAVRSALVSAGVPGRIVSSQGYGDSRPIASSATVSGRIENRRVEIVISGDPIGTLPFWEQTYRLEPRQ
jgi:outer membrane protein OmpA-like peptidoglycan-associated protein